MTRIKIYLLYNSDCGIFEVRLFIDPLSTCMFTLNAKNIVGHVLSNFTFVDLSLGNLVFCWLSYVRHDLKVELVKENLLRDYRREKHQIVCVSD